MDYVLIKNALPVESFQQKPVENAQSRNAPKTFPSMVMYGIPC